ncbi:MAG: hypothetical protein M1838_005530 [Thelocarpon superellum]|nr:MAG: hypothetical protein M1838_005530 [Thelocarpon superellum]
MTDVRSLLRNERNARRITHPHATYSTTGALLCLICHVQIKSESLWDGHVRSSRHAERLKNESGGHGLPNRSSTASPLVESRKRKADEREDGGSKRSKASEKVKGLPEGFFDGGQRDEEAPETLETSAAEQPEVSPDQEETSTASASGSGLPTGFFDDPSSAPQTAPTISAPRNDSTDAANDQTVDEDVYAAFEREIATVTADEVSSGPTKLPSVLTAPSTISAPALSAAELAARSTAEANAQAKERQDAELEGDKEDAARQMEMELEEMEALELKVRRLKERREELRRQAHEQEPEDGGAMAMEADVQQPANGGSGAQDEAESESEDLEEDDWGGWRIKPT